MSAAILWFRNDLRLHDNEAFFSAHQQAEKIFCVYIIDDEAAGEWRMGSASRWWLHHSLKNLTEKLAQFGLNLILRQGSAVEILAELQEKIQAKSLFYNQRYEPWAQAQEKNLQAKFSDKNCAIKPCLANYLHDPESFKNKSGSSFKVFTPFWRSFLESAKIPECRKKSELNLERRNIAQNLEALKISSDNLEQWNLLPKNPDWAQGFYSCWRPGEDGALERLEFFLQNDLQNYALMRDFPSVSAISRLSPHLAFGEISVRYIWHKVKMKISLQPEFTKAGEKFLQEIGWREFSTNLLLHFPNLPTEAIRPEFKNFPWQENKEIFKRWSAGKTGFPIIDAGMRELWSTGFMHNRVRMLVASFLTKHLRISWQEGARWFWDSLLDADLANNSASWQWVAGCGADAAPYFRIFNPILQTEKFDKDEIYIKRFVPEMHSLSYVRPMIDLNEERNNALRAYKNLRPAAD
jgi:deoxyribodipyrimidine photo-lyase